MSAKSLFKNRRALILVAPAIAIAVLINHVYRLHAHDLSPWKGGGMGMFSTVERPGARFIKIFVDIDGQWTPARYPEMGRRTREKLRVEPSSDNLAAFREELQALNWGSVTVDGRTEIHGFEAEEFEGQGADPVHPDGIRVEAWQIGYDPASAMLSTALINAVP